MASTPLTQEHWAMTLAAGKQSIPFGNTFQIYAAILVDTFLSFPGEVFFIFPSLFPVIVTCVSAPSLSGV